ncbi:hypothetical protein LPTSP4_24960 [Leptospira ryugenii]|uniref:Uncharacterized protein n=1 Tax=Leptospira ryugenii TaxID=1917863 RepID=A0A2P2E242_9LEPT|nr:hypothetical protein LPTSP4_24960 [Leptospira ryugenii]
MALCAVVGVPLITPVEESSESPAGRAGDMENVQGTQPPFTIETEVETPIT